VKNFVNFQRRHDRMIRPTVRLMPTSESVKSGGKLKKARWGRGGFFWVKICRGWGEVLGVVTLSMFHGEIH